MTACFRFAVTSGLLLIAGLASATAGVNVATLIPDPPTAQIGWSVALDHGVVLGGAPDFQSQGAVFVFDAATGQQLRILSSPAPWQGDGFGSSVDLFDGKALVGVPGAGPTSHAGAAYLYDGDTGASLHRLVPSDPQRNGDFGHAVALTRTRALVGAYHYDDFAGSAYLFDVGTGQQTAKFSIPPTSTRDWFGWSVAAEGDLAVIGAPGGFTISRGNAYLFDLSTRSLRATLQAPDLATGARFGVDVAISGDFVLVGAHYQNGQDTGAAYLFDATDGRFLHKFTPEDGTLGDEFGLSVALDGRLALVGSRTDQDALNAGSVYVFDVLTGSRVDRFAAPVAMRNSDFGWEVDLDGDTAAVGTSGGPAYTAHPIQIANQPPTIVAATARPSLLWPPNNQMVRVEVSAVVEDDAPGATWKVFAMESSEPHDADDLQFVTAHTVDLRATRAGEGDGRTYVLWLKATDAEGAESEAVSITVSVPHDRRAPHP